MVEKNYKTLKDHAYNYLYEKINNGELSPGRKISTNQICDELGMSITPVREALIQLTNEGFLDKLPRRGYRPKPIS